jgi:hypothetical protein
VEHVVVQKKDAMRGIKNFEPYISCKAKGVRDQHADEIYLLMLSTGQPSNVSGSASRSFLSSQVSLPRAKSELRYLQTWQAPICHFKNFLRPEIRHR